MDPLLVLFSARFETLTFRFLCSHEFNTGSYSPFCSPFWIVYERRIFFASVVAPLVNLCVIDSQAASQARDLVCCPALVSLVLALHNTYLLSAKASPLDPAEEYAVVAAVLAG